MNTYSVGSSILSFRPAQLDPASYIFGQPVATTGPPPHHAGTFLIMNDGDIKAQVRPSCSEPSEASEGKHTGNALVSRRGKDVPNRAQAQGPSQSAGEESLVAGDIARDTEERVRRALQRPEPKTSGLLPATFRELELKVAGPGHGPLHALPRTGGNGNSSNSGNNKKRPKQVQLTHRNVEFYNLMERRLRFVSGAPESTADSSSTIETASTFRCDFTDQTHRIELDRACKPLGLGWLIIVAWVSEVELARFQERRDAARGVQ